MKLNLQKIKEIYENGGNIISYLKSLEKDHSMAEMVMISYDLQAGSYIEKAKKFPEFEEHRANVYAQIIDELGSFDSILEIGIGEATTFKSLIPKLSNRNYSRIQYAKNYLADNGIEDSLLFTGNFLNCPLQENSFDIVYSSHSLEPNGGSEKNILSELFRVAKKYLVLFEPIYELANDKGKAHIDKHGYVKNLYSSAIELGFKVKEYKLIFEDNILGDNCTGVIVIEKSSEFITKRENFSPLACPISKHPLTFTKENFYCKESMLLYPVINSIPCLLPENAIIATHFLDKNNK